MKEQDFLKHFAQNAKHLMWFLGAGTSRTSGLPTANDVTWDLKRKYYCAQENQDVQSHDVNNKAIRSKIQSYMDSRGFPALWSHREYSFYFELMFGTDYAAQQKYLGDALATTKISLTVGHRALAALTHLGLARLIFTTNFDEVVETAYASITGQNISTFHLEGSYAALEALNAERFPIYAKVHGDFRYKSVKNLSADLLSNDQEIQRCFVAAGARYGMVVSGYSGRDENVMSMFRRAIEQNNGFPHGLIWTAPRISSVAANVNELIEFARSKGINAHVVETGTFDEMMSKIWRQMPGKPDALNQKVRTASAQKVSIRLPEPGSAFPVLRTNALLVSKLPASCGTLDYADRLTLRAVKDRIAQATPNAVTAYTDRVLYWGSNDEITKIVEEKDKIRSFKAFELGDPVEAVSKSPFLKSFFEEALVRALCEGKPIDLIRKGSTFFAVARHSAANDEMYKPLRQTLGFNNNPGYISGAIRSLPDVSWAEAASFRLEERNGAFWLLVTPEIWVSPPERRDETKDFIRDRRKLRYNNKANDVLSAWISILLGKPGGADAVTVTCFATADHKADFELVTRSAFSRSVSNGN